jgi:acyl-CoA thioester hydrolase
MKLKENRNRPKLTDTIEIQIRFSEVDSIKMAWHGSYVKYMEDGREAFVANSD